ncbi:MAG: ArgE/DapE family deacylase [Acidobacteriota bacterium]
MRPILNVVSSYSERIVRFTEKLVRVPTENPPGVGYQDCVDVIGAELDELGLEYHIHRISGNDGEDAGDEHHPRFWIESYFGSGDETLYFHGHYDVVPAPSRKQFQPFLRKDNLFGRGSSDMKSGLAAMIYAVKALEAAGVRLDGRIGLTIVPDEETGGRRGSGALSATGLLGRHGIGMLTAEPTSGVVWNACRGAISLRVKVKGRPSRVGLHYRGVNAFERMLEVAQALRELKREVEAKQTAFRIAPEAARSSILMMGGKVEGGDSFNLVPGDCSFTIDRRINPEEDLAVEKKKLLEVLEACKGRGIDLEVAVLQEAPSAGVSEDNPLARGLAESIQAVTGKPAVFEMCPGLLEIRFYAEQGMPAFAYGPGLLSVSHGPNEYVKVKDIEASAAVYALTAARRLAC